MVRPRDNRELYQESWLIRIPVLGYFFRKIAEHREALERTLKTGKETTGKIKKKSFLCGLLGMSSGKKFNILKMRKSQKSKIKND